MEASPSLLGELPMQGILYLHIVRSQTPQQAAEITLALHLQDIPRPLVIR
jgi:hypothetical protein